MSEVINKFLDLPLSRVFIFIGIIFLFFSIIKKLVIKDTNFEFSAFGRLRSGILGFVFLFLGLTMILFTELSPYLLKMDSLGPAATTPPAQNTQQKPNVASDISKNREIIDKINSCMDKASFKSSGNISLTTDSYYYDFVYDTVVDRKNNILYEKARSNTLGITYEEYVDLNNLVFYFKELGSTQWRQATINKDDIKKYFEISDSELSGINQDNSPSSEILLKGDTYLNSEIGFLLKNFFEINSYSITEGYSEISIYKSNNNVKYFYTIVSGTVRTLIGNEHFTLEFKETCYDYSGNNSLKLPD